MKKMLAVTLAVLMAGIVAGCGTKTESSAAAETETAAVNQKLPIRNRPRRARSHPLPVTPSVLA